MKAMIKKLHIGNIYGPAGRLACRLLLTAFAFVQLCSCDEDKAKPERPQEGDQLWRIVPALVSGNDGFEGIGEYGVSLYLFNDMSSDCYKYQHADSFGGLEPFVVEKAAYLLVALMMDRDVPYVSYEASVGAKKNGTVTVTDMNGVIPDMVLGTASVSQEVGATVPVADLKRLVGALDVRLTDVPDDVTGIELVVNDLYDRVDLTGEYGFSAGASVSKRIELEKDGTVFSNRGVMMPSDETQNSVKMNFRVFRGERSEDFVVRFSGGIPADRITRLEGRAEDILKNAELAVGLTYVPWDASVTIEDYIRTDDDLNKVWSSSPLPIGGAADPGYDNFWASSAFTDWDGSVKYDSYLYDGIKDGSDEHKDLYWGPDAAAEAENGTVPSWYMDLGTGRQGVTVTYWNKFGGKGGQKLRTMNVYGSNSENDYGGGNDNWTLITTFTSDKTVPELDAGAEVTTGRIEFDKGNATYRYVKCEITSRVNADGNVVEDSDVNVAEVQITVWSCK